MTAARLAGALLLALGCLAGGVAAARRARQRWQAVRAFGRLLRYLEQAICYRTMTGDEVLAKAAAYPEFAALGLAGCRRLGQLRPPAALEPALRQELCADLESLESAPRAAACGTLRRMACLCDAEESALRARAVRAGRLYPRLGGCLGAAAALLLL